MLSLGVSPPMMSMDELFPVRKIRDITSGILHRFFQKIPSGSQVRKSSMCIIGDQGSGKSVFLESLSALAERQYGPDKVHPIYTDDVRVALDLLTDDPVQLIIVDDAMSWASSRQISNQTEIIKVYNRSRHVFEDKLNGKPGVILYVWAWQRFRELDPSFRQSDVIVFKTGIGEPSEMQLIEKFIGQTYARELNTIWDRMKQGDDDIKSQSVARITSLDVARGTGKFIIPRTPNPRFPRLISHEEHFADDDSENDILAEYEEKPEWKWRIEIHRLKAENPKMTQKEIADVIGSRRGTPVRQGYVSESLRKVRGLIESK